jgi:hypothetical protein
MKNREAADTVLNVLVYKEGSRYFAHCLECDLLGDGKTWQTAVKRLIGVIETQVQYLEGKGCPEKFHHPAPAEYWRMLRDSCPEGAS